MKRLLLSCLALLVCAVMWGQRTVTGTVTDNAGEPLIGANVVAKGTTAGTITDYNGEYELTLPEGVNTIVVSYVGYLTKEVEVGDSDEINVTLLSDRLALEEVVVVGYGEQTRQQMVQSVSTISNEDIENSPVVNTQELLQGQASGVNMTSSSGVLGAQPVVRIRGAASITAGGDPLYVVDGVPLNAGTYSNDLGALGGAGLNPLQTMAPNEIESISVLKDAAATAIYGSRGSNGVVLIKTKKGEEGENDINLDFYTGWNEPTNTLDMMDADQWRQFQENYFGADPSTLPQTSFNWPEAVLQTGRTTHYGLSAKGGDEKTTYYIGGGYDDISSYAIGNELDRLNGRLNFEHEIGENISFGANIGVYHTLNDRIGAENNTFAPLTSAYLQNPTVEARNEDGSYRRTGFIANVVAIEDLSIRNLQMDRLTGNAFAELDITDNLKARTSWGVDRVKSAETIRDPDIVSPGGYGYRRVIEDNKWMQTTSLNYVNSFGKHSLDLYGAFSFETSLQTTTAVEGSDFAADPLRNVASAATPTLTSSSRTEWALASQFFRGLYEYDQRYIVEASIRRDGSSRFGPDNRFGVFWAAAAGWIVSNEEFMSGNDFFDFLKVSASYGTTGNDRIGNYPYQGLYSAGVASDYAGLPGLRPTQAANPELKWEETSQLDVGLSFRILNERLGLEFNYYNKNTTDLLLPFEVPGVNGITVIDRNAGEMENRGFDFSINGDIIQGSEFRWSARLNIGINDNEITALPGASEDREGRLFIPGTDAQRAIVGHPLNTFYMIRYNGVNPETGDAEWLDVDGNTVTEPSANDRVIVGSAQPDFQGGFSTNFAYKGFDLRAFFNFTYGNEVFLDGLTFTDNAVSFNNHVDLFNYWEESGDQAYLPAATSSTLDNFNTQSTNFLFDGSYARLKSLTLGYTFEDIPFAKSARVYVRGHNILTIKDDDFRGADPEVTVAGTNQIAGESFFGTPQSKSIMVGANVTF